MDDPADINGPDLDGFCKHVHAQGKALYRDLPWRYVEDAYQVLVSEVMLQQTQVQRVLKYWDRFITLFPTVDALAAADSSLVLEQWQGLGYNRRALALKRAAEQCSADHGGILPRDQAALLALPGIGPATAAGVRVFAYNEPASYIETNVRAVFIHEFFPERESVRDTELMPLVEASCPDDDPRTWYYALLDYGSQLKKEVANPSRKSAHYTRQSRFEGSHRQKRAFLLKVVLAEPGISAAELSERLGAAELSAGRAALAPADFDALVGELVAEGFFKRVGDAFTA